MPWQYSLYDISYQILPGFFKTERTPGQQYDDVDVVRYFSWDILSGVCQQLLQRYVWGASGGYKYAHRIGRQALLFSPW